MQPNFAAQPPVLQLELHFLKNAIYYPGGGWPIPLGWNPDRPQLQPRVKVGLDLASHGQPQQTTHATKNVAENTLVGNTTGGGQPRQDMDATREFPQTMGLVIATCAHVRMKNLPHQDSHSTGSQTG